MSTDVYSKFYERFKDKINIICIYILEAHFVESEDLDGWPIGHYYRIPQHKTIEDRIKIAKQFVSEFNWKIPTFVDSMKNDFNTVYSAWPDNVYYIKDNKLVYYGRLNADGSRDTFFTNDIIKLIETNS